MSFSAAAISILERLTTAAVVPAANIAYDAFGGARFKPPAGAVWIRPAITGVGAEYLAWGDTAKWTRHDDILRFQVFSEIGEGEDESFPVAEALSTLYHLAVFGGLHFGPGHIERVPSAESEPWHQLEVTIPFHRQETT